MLGLPAIMSLQLVCRVDTVCSEEEMQKQFPKVCNELGTLGEPYVIKLKPDVNPYALFTARNVPIPQHYTVRDEPERMESMGVIVKVTAPIQWCISMVVMPKSSGAVKICIDLRPFNESILRKPDSVSTVDETLAQLSKATVFNKVDANYIIVDSGKFHCQKIHSSTILLYLIIVLRSCHFA